MDREPGEWRSRLHALWVACAYHVCVPFYVLWDVGQWLTRGWGERLRWLWHAGVWHVGFALYLVGAVLVHTWYFVAWSWHHEVLRLLMQGLPALLIGGSAVVLAGYLKLTPVTDAVDGYAAEAQRAFEDQDYAVARVCYERLALLEPDKPEHRFGLAQASLGLGEPQRGWALLAQIAPSNRQGYAPAHLLLAQSLLAKAVVGTGALREAEGHLRRALQGDPGLLPAHALLGNIYLTTNRRDEAEAHLLKVVEIQPDVRFALAGLFERQGRKDEASRQLEAAEALFAGRAKASPDDHQGRLYWARAKMQRGDFAGAVKVLEAGQAVAPLPDYQRALTQVYLKWSDAVADGSTAAADRLALLEQALRYDAGSEDLARRLLALSKGKGGDADRARAALQQMLARSPSPAAIHLLLGMDAWEGRRHDEARRHLEAAYRASPEAVVAANNLAWTLAHANPPDLPRALEIINAAIRRVPNYPQIRDTRGHILAKMGRWREALIDLEAALPGLAEKRDTHRVLAEAYRQTGNSEMAAAHRRLADAQ